MQESRIPAYKGKYNVELPSAVFSDDVPDVSLSLTLALTLAHQPHGKSEASQHLAPANPITTFPNWPPCTSKLAWACLLTAIVYLSELPCCNTLHLQLYLNTKASLLSQRSFN
jgi:hypothetical protein